MREIKTKTALYKIRKARGLSQRQLAAAVNTSNQQISALENGERKLAPEWLERLSKVLNCTKAELLGEEPAETLTPEEKIVLENFRTLSQDKKDVIKTTIFTFAESEKRKDEVG